MQGATSIPQNRFSRFVLVLCSVLLLSTAGLKLTSVVWSAPILDIRDRLLPISGRVLLLLVATIEIIVAAYLLLGTNVQRQHIALSWLATCFLTYRIAHWFWKTDQPCKCLGAAFDWFPWLNHHGELISKCIMIMLLIGGYSFLIREQWVNFLSNRIKD